MIYLGISVVVDAVSWGVLSVVAATFHVWLFTLLVRYFQQIDSLEPPERREILRMLKNVSIL
jgi:hypothetical protein